METRKKENYEPKKVKNILTRIVFFVAKIILASIPYGIYKIFVYYVSALSFGCKYGGGGTGCDANDYVIRYFNYFHIQILILIIFFSIFILFFNFFKKYRKRTFIILFSYIIISVLSAFFYKNFELQAHNFIKYKINYNKCEQLPHSSLVSTCRISVTYRYFGYYSSDVQVCSNIEIIPEEYRSYLYDSPNSIYWMNDFNIFRSDLYGIEIFKLYCYESIINSNKKITKTKDVEGCSNFKKQDDRDLCTFSQFLKEFSNSEQEFLKNAYEEDFSVVSWYELHPYQLHASRLYSYNENIYLCKEIVNSDLKNICYSKINLDIDEINDLWSDYDWIVESGGLKLDYIDLEKIKNSSFNQRKISSKDSELGYYSILKFGDGHFYEDGYIEYVGVGIKIGIEDGVVTVLDSLKNGPADLVGIMSGDKLIKVDEAVISGMVVPDVVDLIKGEKDTTVKLTIYRENTGESFEIPVTRGQIETLKSEYKNNQYIESSKLGLTLYKYLTDEFKKGEVYFSNNEDSLLSKNEYGDHVLIKKFNLNSNSKIDSILGEITLDIDLSTNFGLDLFDFDTQCKFVKFEDEQGRLIDENKTYYKLRPTDETVKKYDDFCENTPTVIGCGSWYPCTSNTFNWFEIDKNHPDTVLYINAGQGEKMFDYENVNILD